MNIFIAVKRTQTHEETDLKRKRSAAAAAAAAMKKIYSVSRSTRSGRTWLKSKPVNILNYIVSDAVGGKRAESKLKRIRLTIHSLNQSEKRQTEPERGSWVGKNRLRILVICDSTAAAASTTAENNWRNASLVYWYLFFARNVKKLAKRKKNIYVPV